MASKSANIRTNDEELRIVMVGKTGVGKSATGNTILGERRFDSKLSATSLTMDCSKGKAEVDGQKVSVVDTPGLFDTRFDSQKTSEDISQCISFAAPGPHVFLVVIRLGRFTEEEKQTVKRIQEIFGEAADKYSMVLFTGGDALGNATIEDFVNESADLQELVRRCNGQYHVFNNKLKDHTQVSELIKKIKDIVQKNGGSHYTTEMFQEAERAIEEEKQRILKENEEKRHEEIEKLEREAKERYEQQIQEMQEQMQAERERERKEIEEERKREKEEMEEQRRRDRKEMQEEKNREREAERERQEGERENEDKMELLKEEHDRKLNEERKEVKSNQEEDARTKAEEELRRKEREAIEEEKKRFRQELEEQRRKDREAMEEERKRERETREAERERERLEREKENENKMKLLKEEHERKLNEEREKLKSKQEEEARTKAEESNPWYYVRQAGKHFVKTLKALFTQEK